MWQLWECPTAGKMIESSLGYARVACILITSTLGHRIAVAACLRFPAFPNLCFWVPTWCVERGVERGGGTRVERSRLLERPDLWCGHRSVYCDWGEWPSCTPPRKVFGSTAKAAQTWRIIPLLNYLLEWFIQRCDLYTCIFSVSTVNAEHPPNPQWVHTPQFLNIRKIRKPHIFMCCRPKKRPIPQFYTNISISCSIRRQEYRNSLLLEHILQS